MKWFESMGEWISGLWAIAGFDIYHGSVTEGY
jgi:hypothetical protein